MAEETTRLQTCPFDDLATDYDASFTTTSVGMCLRSLVWQRLDEVFAGCRRILEIGCGTGEDAVYLARRGFSVTATDPSMPMLRAAHQKANQAGLAQRIQHRCVPMEHLAAEFAGEEFDGAFSNFGAVNCVSSLDSVIPDFARMLRPGAPLVWVVMGRHVPWEWAWFLLRGQWQKAFRRQRNGGAAWRGMRIFYPTPEELTHKLSPEFATIRRRALGFVLPPTYASGWLEGAPRLLRALTNVERAAQRWQPLAAFADHYIIEARRAPAQADA